MKNLQRIMLVDDDVNANFYNKYILHELNPDLDIIECTSTSDALAHFKNSDDLVDILLLDINMPLMNGWQFLEQYDKLPSHRIEHTIIIMLTSSINPDDKNKIINYPYVRAFLNKPLEFEKLEVIRDIYFKAKEDKNTNKKEFIEYVTENRIVIASYTGVLSKDEEVKFISKVAQYSLKKNCNYILFDMTNVVESFGLYDSYDLN